MKRNAKFKTMPATLESFGAALDFLSRFEPFSTTNLDTIARAVRRQMLNGKHVVTYDGDRIIGYAGWLPTTQQSGDAWADDRGELEPADTDADAAALTTVAVEDPTITLGLMRACRDLNPGIRVFFKRAYGNRGRGARKASVLNTTGIAPAERLEKRKPTSTAPRPAIADDPCLFLYALAEQHPGETMRIPVGETSVVIVQDPALAARVLVGNLGNYTKNFASFTPFFGRSRLTLDGEAWRHSQRISQSFIAPHDTARALALVARIYDDFADALLATGGGPTVIDGLIDRAAVAALTEVAFSTPLDVLGASFAEDLRPIIRYAAARAWDLPGVPSGADSAMLAHAQSATDKIRAAMAALVEHRRTSGPENDALSALIAAADETQSGPEETRIDLAGELLTLVVAGSDTTSAALGWALSVLASAPDFQDQLREEIRATIGDHDPSMADFDRISSLRPFIEEILRVFPPVAILSRFAQASDMIGNEAIVPGDRVLVSVIGLHQNPSAWDAPREFRIDRHDPHGEGRADRKSNFMAFSAGPRICGGARFAQIEMATALIKVLRKSRLELAESLPFAFEWGASMRRRGGQKMKIIAL